MFFRHFLFQFNICIKKKIKIDFLPFYDFIGQDSEDYDRKLGVRHAAHDLRLDLNPSSVSCSKTLQHVDWSSLKSKPKPHSWWTIRSTTKPQLPPTWYALLTDEPPRSLWVTRLFVVLNLFTVNNLQIIVFGPVGSLFLGLPSHKL